MTARQRKILHLLIDKYVETGMSVSSSTLATALGISAATIRYDLIALEHDGYLKKAHISSGRIPTQAGFRNFALSKLPPGLLPSETFDKLSGILEGAEGKREKLVVQLASRLSGYPALLRIKNIKTSKPVRLHLSTLESGRILIVAVMADGKIRETRATLSFSPTQSQLDEIERGFLAGATQNAQRNSPSMQEIFDFVENLQNSSLVEEYREGMGLLLAEPEANQPSFLREALQTFENPKDDSFTPPGRINVQIGDGEFSWIQAGVSLGGQVGELALLGPMRMRYEHALSIANTMGKTYMGS